MEFLSLLHHLVDGSRLCRYTSPEPALSNLKLIPFSLFFIAKKQHAILISPYSSSPLRAVKVLGGLEI